MGNWIAKAAGVLRGRAEPIPYEVTSSAGKVVEGVREPEHQVVKCPATGERLFVLPADPYPAPKGAKAKRRKRRGRKRDRGRESVAEPREPVGSPDVKPPAEDRPTRQRRLREGVRRGLRLAREKAGAWFTPLRGLLVGVTVVVVVTLFWVWRSRAIANAEIVLRQATEAAWVALDAGDVDEANDQFRQAVDALDTLGLDDPGVRRAAREVRVATELSETALFDVFAHADRIEDHLGEWMVFDAVVVAEIDLDGDPIVRLELPIEVDGIAVDVVADPEVFAGLDVPDADSGDVLTTIFAARLGSLERGGGAFPRWTLRLDAETAFLWTSERTIGAVGIEPDVLRDEAELRDILERQTTADDALNAGT